MLAICLNDEQGYTTSWRAKAGVPARCESADRALHSMHCMPGTLDGSLLSPASVWVVLSAS
jgi:hypothetical protein